MFHEKFLLGGKAGALRQNQKNTFIGGLFDGECPYGDPLRTPQKGITSRQYYFLNDNIAPERRQGILVLPIFDIMDVFWMIRSYNRNLLPLFPVFRSNK